MNLNSEKKYVFIVNNLFHITYYISLSNKLGLKNSLFIINNTNNFFYSGNYHKVFNKNNIKYFVCCGENYTEKSFFYKIPLDYIYTYINLFKYRKYNIIISDDNNVSNQIIINCLGVKNKDLILINNNLYGYIHNKYKLKNLSKTNLLYNCFLKVFRIHKRREIGKNYIYNTKYYVNDIDNSIIKNSEKYLFKLFKNYFIGLEKIIQKNKNLIIFSQNIIDEGRISKQDYLLNLKTIEKKYQGYNIYIKPHPLENIEYYQEQYQVLDKYIPSELLDIYLGKFKNNIYLTYYSTIILNTYNGERILIQYDNFPKEENIIINELNNKFNINKMNLNA